MVVMEISVVPVQLLLLTMKVQLSKQYKKPDQILIQEKTIKDDLAKINQFKIKNKENI